MGVDFAEIGRPEQAQEELKNLSDIVRIKQSIANIVSLRGLFENGEREAIIRGFESLFHRPLNTESKNTLKEYMADCSVLLGHELQGINMGEDDDEIIMGGQFDTLKCPISQNWYEDAVTNPSCGHSFSKRFIQDYAARTGNVVACPVAGCNKSIALGHLVRNYTLDRKVLRQKCKEILREDSRSFLNVE